MVFGWESSKEEAESSVLVREGGVAFARSRG